MEKRFDANRLAGLRNWADRAVAQSPALQQGLVRCERCGSEERVDSAQALRSGWPTCCGTTMTLLEVREG